MTMQYTQDWFSHNVPGLLNMLKQVPDKQNFLEIGSFEGRSTCWFLQHAMAKDGSITCIDTFRGSEEHAGMDLSEIKERFLHNTAQAKAKKQTVEVMEMPSFQGLGKLLGENRLYDFIYVDGSHISADVMSDACMAYNLLRFKGVMVFDDYLWGGELPVLHSPKMAIDMFCTLFKEKVNIVMIGYQLAVIKVA